MLFYDVTSSLFRGLLDDDETQAINSDFEWRPLHPVTRTNGAFNPHHCDEDDMEGRFKKIVVSPFADAIEERLPQQQPLERRPSLTQAQPVGNANGGAGKWEGKQSGRNGKELAISILFNYTILMWLNFTLNVNLKTEGRKGYQPKKLPRAPINDIAEELRHRSLSESPRPLVIADPGATVPVNGSNHSGEHSPPQVGCSMRNAEKADSKLHWTKSLPAHDQLHG